MPKLPAGNVLFYGDNQKLLRQLPDECADLIYLDPPFNSNADYNMLFREATGEVSQAQFHAFADTWEWTTEVDRTFDEFVRTCENGNIVELMGAFRGFLKTSPMMAYITMMAPRLVELRRVLKPTGCLYLHCDPTADHFLRILLDGIFGAENFLNEIIWKRTHSHGGASRYGPIHDTILFYSKTNKYKWVGAYTPYSENYVKEFFKFADTDGKRYRSTILTGSGIRGGSSGREWRGINPTAINRHWAVPGYVRKILPKPEVETVQEALDQLDAIGRVLWPKKEGGTPSFKQYLDDFPGVPVQDIIDDIPPIGAKAEERLGYPTQKPAALLERFIAASSMPGDLVLDPFCGCGTTVHAAQKLGRRWVGIDITYLAIDLIKRRLREAFPPGSNKPVSFTELGQPTDITGAKRLAEVDKFQFQQWALSLAGVSAMREGNIKGADRGVDGLVYFYESKTERAKIIVQVKGGGVKRSDMATLLGDVTNQKAAAGVLVTLERPSKPMIKEAIEAGRYKSSLFNSEHPKMQILTVEGLLSGEEKLNAPPTVNPFAKAGIEAAGHAQQDLL